MLASCLAVKWRDLSCYHRAPKGGPCLEAACELRWTWYLLPIPRPDREAQKKAGHNEGGALREQSELLYSQGPLPPGPFGGTPLSLPL